MFSPMALSEVWLVWLLSQLREISATTRMDFNFASILCLSLGRLRALKYLVQPPASLELSCWQRRQKDVLLSWSAFINLLPLYRLLLEQYSPLACTPKTSSVPKPDLIMTGVNTFPYYSGTLYMRSTHSQPLFYLIFRTLFLLGKWHLVRYMAGFTTPIL